MNSNPFDIILSRLDELEKKIDGNKPVGNQDATHAKLVCTKTLEAMYGISRTTIWRMRRDGVLPSYKVGSRNKYKIAEVEAALKTMAA